MRLYTDSEDAKFLREQAVKRLRLARHFRRIKNFHLCRMHLEAAKDFLCIARTMEFNYSQSLLQLQEAWHN